MVGIFIYLLLSYPSCFWMKKIVPEGPVALVSAGPPPRIRFRALSWVKLGADSAVISSSSDGDENSGRRVSAKSNGADDASSRLVVRTVWLAWIYYLRYLYFYKMIEKTGRNFFFPNKWKKEKKVYRKKERNWEGVFKKICFLNKKKERKIDRKEKKDKRIVKKRK